jgi:hypothetical protein
MRPQPTILRLALRMKLNFGSPRAGWAHLDTAPAMEEKATVGSFTTGRVAPTTWRSGNGPADRNS